MTSRAESRKHQATAHRRRGEGLPGPVAPDREVLRRQLRTAAAGAGSLPEFFGRLRADGLLVRERFSERNPGEITGSAVALLDRYDTGGKPIYFGGGKLATDLTVPRLQRRWPGGAPADTAPPAGADRASTGAAQAGRADRFRLTPTERPRIWAQASLAAGNATEQITSSALSDPAASAADAAWAASDFLAAAGRVVEGRRGGPLSAAALAYDEAGRELFGRPPEPTAAGRGLRAAGRLLLAAHVAKPSETKQLLALLAQLVALADAVTRLRETRQRAAPAAAARQAAEQLRAVAARYQPPAASGRLGTQTAGRGRTGQRGWPSVVLPAPRISRGRRR